MKRCLTSCSIKNKFSKLSYRLYPDGSAFPPAELDDAMAWLSIYVFNLCTQAACVISLQSSVNKLGRPFSSKAVNFYVKAFISLNVFLMSEPCLPFCLMDENYKLCCLPISCLCELTDVSLTGGVSWMIALSSLGLSVIS